MKKRGAHEWNPKVLVDEIRDIMNEDKISSPLIAKKKSVQYIRVGREVKRMIKLDFSRSPINTNIFGKKKEKKR